MISSIKEIRFGELAKATPDQNTIANYITYAMNSAIAFFASLGLLLLLANALSSFRYTQCYDNSRVSSLNIFL
jgi:hypothetical protein